MAPTDGAGTSSERWVEVTARVAPADVEVVADALREAGAEAVSIEPAIRISDDADFAYDLLDAPSIVRASLAAPFEASQRRALRRRLDALVLATPLDRLRYADLEDRDWSEEWKRFFTVLRVGRLVVRPSWEPYEAAPGEVVIDLDPGSAFGTGQHETTRLCLGALQSVVTPGVEVLDVGAGSGILAIAAARLGVRSVRALDNDLSTVAVARENAARNGVASVVHAEAGSLGAGWPWPEAARASADVVVANISSTVMAALMPEVASALRPGGRFVGSGFTAPGGEAVEAAARAAGLRIDGSEWDGEWGCLLAPAP